MNARTTLAAALLLAASSQPGASAQEPGAAAHGPLPATPGSPVARTLSEEFGADIIPMPAVALPEIDNEFYIAEDEVSGAGSGPRPLRFAIERPVDLTPEDGQWIPVNGGRLWRVEITGANAFTARLHLTGIDLPAGQQLRLSNPGQFGSVIGPIQGVGEFGDGSAWGLALPTPRTAIEWFVPEGFVAKQLPFAQVAYLHGYRDIWADVGPQGEGGVAGNCHNQPACYGAWSLESNGTIRLIFGAYLCSGQLTATTAADETPYVSTANHCISTQTDANSCQFNFFYRANTCGGSTSAGSNVTGSDLVITYTPSDCTLLMIRPTLPANVGWIGWTSAAPALNTLSTGLHHPGGAPQAISFGVKNASAFNCGSPTTNWASLSWNNGITEGGSSGSAIYRDSDHRMYGVLTCGGSSCTNTAADDGYGRWDVAVNSGGFAARLGAGSDDALEPNDGCISPRAITPGSYTGLVVKRVSEDWYALPVPRGSTVNVSVTYTYANGNVDLQLLNGCGNVLTGSYNTVNNATLAYANTTASDTLLLRVYLASDTRNDYTLTFSTVVAAPSNDNCASATAATTGAYGFNTSAATGTPLMAPPACDEGAGTAVNNDVWYRFTAPCAGTARATTCGTAAFDTRIVVYAGDACPTVGTPSVTCNDNDPSCTAGTSTVQWPVTAGSAWYVRVGSPAAGGGVGTIAFSCAVACQADLDHDGAVGGSDLSTLLGNWGAGSAGGDLDGDGSTTGTDLSLLLGAWGPCP